MAKQSLLNKLFPEVKSLDDLNPDELAAYEKEAAKIAKDLKSGNPQQGNPKKKEPTAKEPTAKELYEKSLKVPLLKKTRANYHPEPGTEEYYHILQEQRSFNANTGKRNSKPILRLQNPKMYELIHSQSQQLGYTITVLYDPTGEYPEEGIATKE